MKFRTLWGLAVLGLAAVPTQAVITVQNITDKTKYDAPRAFTVVADPSAVTTTARLDGQPVAVGSAVTVTAFGYHELTAESRLGDGALVDSIKVRFITRDPSRGDTEDGIPPFTPYRTVNDAPSAFAGQTLKVIAPAAWPAGLPIPLAAVLRNGANETVRLNGLVSFAGLPSTTLQLRRGWGSVVAPAVTSAGPLPVGAQVNGLTANPTIQIEAAPGFTDASGVIAGNTTWPANSRIHVTSTLTINAGVTLTIGSGTIVTLFSGTGVAGSAAEIVVNGTLQVNGTETSPVVFAPDAPGRFWGGMELPVPTSQVNATFAIFTGSGEDATWFDTHSGYSTHKPQQALFLVAGSGSGTGIGAQLHLNNCYCFSLAGQEMNSRGNTWVDLNRTLMQRAITCGELNGTKVTIDRCALLEFPSEDATFVDGDNDALYLTNGDEFIANTVIGFGKDDGVDSGGNGGDNPFTPGADVTPFLSQGNWYEGTYHEGNSLSGTRNVTFTNCVFFNCGQGVEDGYSTSATGDGPNAIVSGCLFSANMVGVRWGDNYGSGYSYNGAMEVKSSLVLYSLYHDAFSGQWHPTQTNAWIYEDATASNTFGRPYFNVHDSYLSQPDPVHHPANTTWDPAVHGPLLEPFMPVPGSAVGVAISSYAPAQGDSARYPGTFTVRLSTFSSKRVTVNWAVIAKSDPASATETTLASGALTFEPGQTLKTINAPIANPASFGLIHVGLTDPVNAEVTGEAWYFRSPATVVTLIPLAGSGWRYREARSEPPAAWKELNFDDSSPAATEWLAATLPAGFGVPGVTYGTTVTSGSSTDRTRAFYFRRKFNVADPSRFTTMSFRIRRDDAAAVWLNNEATPTVISADGSFNPPYTYAMTGTSGAVPNSTSTGTYFTYTLPPAKLVAGVNILAIEVHQSSLTSSDLILDCELTASDPGLFEVHISRLGTGAILYWFDDAAILDQTATLPGGWSPVVAPLSPISLDLGGPSQFFRLRR
jgi:hypothetical protein